MPDSVKFGPGIEEALPYTTMAHAAYPPPAATLRDDLAATAKATTMELHCASSFIAFLASKQRKTLGNLPEVFEHLEAALLYSYVEEGILMV